MKDLQSPATNTLENKNTHAVLFSQHNNHLTKVTTLYIKTYDMFMPGSLLCVTGQRREVQLVFSSEDHVLGPDLQDGRGLQRSRDGEQGELRRGLSSVFLPLVLSVQKLKSALDVQSLERKEINPSNELISERVLFSFSIARRPEPCTPLCSR